MIDNFIAIGQSFAKFQLIECTLKTFIVRNQIHLDTISGDLKKLYSVDTLIDLPYGVLLKRYNKFCSDKSLHQRLVILKDYRNYLAHQAFIAGSHSISADTKSLMGINPIVIDYVELNCELDECLELLSKDYNTLFKKHDS